MVTLKDIAKQAGVSIMTVSNVANGKHKRVSKEKLEIITDLMEQHKYRPNSAARALSSHCSKIIMFFINNGEFENPHNVKMLSVIEQTIKQHGYDLMIFSSSDAEDAINKIVSWNVDGVICFAPMSDIEKKLHEHKNIPAVFIDSYYPSDRITKVSVDDFGGGYLAARYLIGCGHTKIGFASYDTTHNCILKTRLEGFQTGLEESNIQLCEKSIYVADTNYQGGIEISNQIVDCQDSITAIFATEDEMAIGIMEGARLNGIIVPQQLSVIGFDNALIASYVTPKLTTIGQDITEKGKKAVELLLEMIQSGKPSQNYVKIPVRIVERQSVIRIC